MCFFSFLFNYKNININNIFYNKKKSKKKREGKGIFEWIDGRKYEGEYLNDKYYYFCFFFLNKYKYIFVHFF